MNYEERSILDAELESIAEDIKKLIARIDLLIWMDTNIPKKDVNIVALLD